MGGSKKANLAWRNYWTLTLTLGWILCKTLLWVCLTMQSISNQMFKSFHFSVYFWNYFLVNVLRKLAIMYIMYISEIQRALVKTGNLLLLSEFNLFLFSTLCKIKSQTTNCIQVRECVTFSAVKLANINLVWVSVMNVERSSFFSLSIRNAVSKSLPYWLLT